MISLSTQLVRRALLVSVGDATSRQIVRRELDQHFVAGKDADEVLSHLAGDVGQDFVLVLQLDLKHRVRQCLEDRSCHFNRVFLRHTFLYVLHLPRTHGPLAVTATEFSKCAARAPSTVRAVHPSESVFTSWIIPFAPARSTRERSFDPISQSIGSMARTIPSRSSSPRPRRPKLCTCGSSCIRRPIP